MPTLPIGTNFGNFLTPTDNTYEGIVHSMYLKGGFQEVPSIAERNLIPVKPNDPNGAYTGFTDSGDGGWTSGRRKVGMLVYVLENNKLYSLLPVGYFGNGGSLGETEWNALNDAQKAVRTSPDGEFTIEPAFPGNGFVAQVANASTEGISNDPNGCWVELQFGGSGIDDISYNQTDGKLTVTDTDGVEYSAQINSGYNEFEFLNEGQLVYKVGQDSEYHDPVNNANPTLYVDRGETYIFRNNTGGHPIIINENDAAGAQLSSGILAGTLPISDQSILVWQVPNDALDQYYYYCEAHPDQMNGLIMVKGGVGESGTSGSSGSSGTNGQDGTSGSSGSSGTNGQDGTSGSSGSSGTNGQDGTSGSSGSSGTNGQDGTSGSSGTNGQDGTSGSSGSSGQDGRDGAGSGRIYYFNDSVIEVAGIKQLGTEPTSGDERTVTEITAANNDTLIETYISSPFDFTIIPGGVQRFFLWMSKENEQDDLEVYVNLYVTDNAGNVLATAGTSQSVNIGWNNNNTTAVEHKVDIAFPSTTVAIGQRMMVEVVVRNNENQNRNATLYTEGASHYSYVITTVALQSGLDGTSGSSGTSGVSGTSGSSGLSGVDGQDGTSGSSGSSGTSGQDGTSGISGTSGSSGSSGTTGQDGTSGTSGSSGTNGQDGTSGSSGTNGQDGTSGSSGVSDRYATVSNTSFTLGNSGTIIVETDLAYTKAQSIIIVHDIENFQECEVISYNKDTGELSFGIPTRIVGSGTYSNWEINLDGATGGDGTSGSSGSSGTNGQDGTSGSSGTNGIDGTSGSSGSSGTNGQAGTSGSSGTNGIDGTSGSSGTNGQAGTSGSSGTSGVSGTSGSSGLSGVDGQNGTSGSSGTSGQAGTSGSSGTSGVSGTSGSSGTTGIAGTSGSSGTNGQDGTSGSSGTSGIDGLISVNALCSGVELTGDTDVYAFIDTTSGPYTDSTNRALVLNALSTWHAQYKADNPSYTGNLYAAQSSNQGIGGERWLSHLGIIRHTTDVNGRTNYYASSAANLSTTGNGWLLGGSGFGYSWDLAGVPVDWGNTDYVAPDRAFFIEFCNEADSSYHSQDRAFTAEPRGDWNTDWATFTTEYAAMDYFGGIFYPVATTGTGTHLHAYAAIEGQNPISEVDFEAALGANYASPSNWTSVFTTGVTENPYVSSGVDLAGYNWYGVYDKQEADGVLQFNGAEFAGDINGILDAGAEGGASAINVFESYTDQVLTLRGLKSEDIVFTLDDSGCIVMNINDTIASAGTSGSSGSSGTSGVSGTSGSSGTSGVSGTSGSSGTSGAPGAPGTPGAAAYQYEHIALNPIGRTEAFVPANIAQNFIFVPNEFSGSILVKIETSFGAAAATDPTVFTLKSVTAAGVVNIHATWTHTAGLKHYVINTGITSSDSLHGRTVYIECTDGGTGASGYTASLQWQQGTLE